MTNLVEGMCFDCLILEQLKWQTENGIRALRLYWQGKGCDRGQIMRKKLPLYTIYGNFETCL